jgi:hypothetical protein
MTSARSLWLGIFRVQDRTVSHVRLVPCGLTRSIGSCAVTMAVRPGDTPERVNTLLHSKPAAPLHSTRKAQSRHSLQAADAVHAVQWKVY